MSVAAGNVTPPDSRLHASKLSRSKVMSLIETLNINGPVKTQLLYQYHREG